MSRTIVAVFASRAEAERVADELMGNGIARGDIRIADASTRQEYERRGERSGGGFWSWLFGSSDDDAWSADVDYYNEGIGRGASVLTVDANDRDADRVQRTMEMYGARVESGGGTPTGTDAAAARGGRDEEIVPIAEEQLRVGKRAVTRGGVRIYTRVTDRPVEEDIRLREEHVNVERRPVDRPVGSAGGDAFRERSFQIDETVEEPVVAKEVRIIEEVVITKNVQERSAKVRDTVRRTDVEVDRGGADRGDASTLEGEFRTHCAETFAREGLSYEQCAPAYRYGYMLGSDGQAAPGDWDAAEADARRRWEERNPGTWDRFRAAIRYAWDRARGARRAA
jgi:uncharacterized protein (TIGR02271 family)